MKSRPVRVLTVIDTLGLGGGAERLLVSLLPALKTLGVETELAVLRRVRDEVTDELAPFVTIHHAPRWPHRRAGRLGAVAWVRHLAAHQRYGAMWGHMWHGNLIVGAATGGLPSVITLHTALVGDTPGAKLRRSLEGVVGRRATRRVAVSGATAASYRQAHGWPDVEVIHNGIAVPARSKVEGDPGMLRATLGLEPGRPLVVFPGRLVAQKGHQIALDAMAALGVRRPHLACIGQGPLAGHLRQYADRLQLGSDVSFLGAVPQMDLFRWFVAADCVILPSLEEPFGLAAAEAMALGAPTVLSRAGGFLEIEGGSGGARLVDVGNSTHLASAIQDVLTSGELRAELSRRGRERAAYFDVERCAARWSTLLHEVVDSN